MPNTINYQLLRYQSDNIPSFDGNPKLLKRFINASENLLKAFQNTTTPSDSINICLFDTILSKLTGRAAELIVSRTELNSWILIKNALLASFEDQRSIDCLIQDLINLKPQKNESPTDFGMRIQDSRSLLFSKLDNSGDNQTTKLIKIQHYDEFALKTFINGLPYNLQLVTRLKNPDTLEKAMSLVTEEENFIYFKNSSMNKSLPNQSEKTNFSKSTNTNNNNQYFNSQFRNVNPYRSNINPNFQNTNNNFPGQLMNQNNFFRPNNPFQQNRFPQNNFPRPNNNFPQNSFPQNNFMRFPQTRPNFPNSFNPNFQRNVQYRQPQTFGSRRQVLQKPEPMDTTSTNTALNNNLQTQNVISQELYNQEVLQQTSEQENINCEQDNFDYQQEYYDNTEYQNDHQIGYDQSYDNCLNQYNEFSPDTTNMEDINFSILSPRIDTK